MAEIPNGSGAVGGSSPSPYSNPFAGPAEPATAPTPRRDRGALVRAGGLLAAGLLIGSLATAALTGGDDASAAPATAALSAAAAQGAGPGRLQPGSAGTARLAGTVTAVGSDSVTVRGAGGGTYTVEVDASTQIARAGTQVELSELEAGDLVLVQVSGGVADQIVVGGRSGVPDSQTPDSQTPDSQAAPTAPADPGFQT